MIDFWLIYLYIDIEPITCYTGTEEDTMPAHVHTYYISDKAYNALTGMGQRRRFIPFGTARVKGLSEFLSLLARSSFEDTRPPNVKLRHQEEMAHNRAPNWAHSRQRRARPLTLTDDAIARYWNIAFLVGITRAEGFAIGGPPTNIPYPSVAYVLEAIGLGWLTPDTLPLGSK